MFKRKYVLTPILISLCLVFAALPVFAQTSQSQGPSLRLKPSTDSTIGATGLVFEVEDTANVDIFTVDGAGDIRAAETGGSTSDPDFQISGYAKALGTLEVDGTLQQDAAFDLNSTMTLDTATANPFILTSTIAGASTALKVYDNADDVTGQQYLLALDYDDNADTDADFIIARDNQAATQRFLVDSAGKAYTGSSAYMHTLALIAAGQSIYSGSIVLDGAGQGTVTFPTAFGAAPIVVATSTTSAAAVRVYTIVAGSFDVAGTALETINYVATGQAP